MPHKITQAREQQHHRRLPHVKEEVEGEQEEDEAGYARCIAIAKASSNQSEGTLKKTKGPSETLVPMEVKYGRLESSPLPLRRAVLSSVAGRKCGPSTPVPMWKMYDNPFQAAMEPANSNANTSSVLRGVPSAQSGGVGRVSLSARKLAATLWELQGAPNPYNNGGRNPRQHIMEASPARETTSTAPAPSTNASKERVSQHVNGMPSHHHHHQHEDEGGSSKPSKPSKLRKTSRKDARPHSPSSPSPNQVEAVTGSTSFAKTSPAADVNIVQSGGEDGTTLSCELVRVLNQIWSLEEQHNMSTSMVASLRSDLKKTKAQVQELRTEQSSYQEDIEMLNKKLADEKVMLQDRAQEAILAAIKPFKEELENERKMKLKLESKHKKLSKEMNEARKSLAKTMQDFEREQKARELMEDVCDELAREIGDDKAQVEELKRQSAKYREEVEQERQMLQMAEVWREERVQMKLAEARLEMEEKNAALDKLRGELEAFLKVKRSIDDGNNSCSGTIVSGYDQVTPSALHASDYQSLIKESNIKAVAPDDMLLDEKRVSDAVGEPGDEDSVEDDLHSIELNRMSISGNYDSLSLAHGNGIHSKATANGKHSLNDGTSQRLLNSPLANGVNNGKQGDSNRLRLERISSMSGKALMAESNSGEIQEVDSQETGKGFENGVKDWDLGRIPVAWSREGLPSLWQNDIEGVKGCTVAWEKGRPVSGYLDSASRRGSKDQSMGATVSSVDLQGDGAVSNLQVFELPRDRKAEAENGDGVLSFSKQSSTFPSSPTRQWAHSQSSPDPAGSRRASQGVEDMPKVFKDNSLKARLLEAKLEGQQAKLRNNKVH